jgi:hypothetical protein
MCTLYPNPSTLPAPLVVSRARSLTQSCAPALRPQGSRSTAPARTPHTAHCTPHTATATAHRTPHAALRHRTPPPHTAHRTPPPHTARRHRTPRAQLASQAGRLAPAPRPARRSSLEPAGRPRLGEAAAPRRCGGARRGSRRGVLRRGDPSGRSERLQVRSALLAAVGAASRHPTAVEELEPVRTRDAFASAAVGRSRRVGGARGPGGVGASPRASAVRPHRAPSLPRKLADWPPRPAPHAGASSNRSVCRGLARRPRLVGAAAHGAAVGGACCGEVIRAGGGARRGCRRGARRLGDPV